MASVDGLLILLWVVVLVQEADMFFAAVRVRPEVRNLLHIAHRIMPGQSTAGPLLG
jgi:hypothetical protein